MDTVKHIYLVRHGESRSNLTHVAGDRRTPLTKRGEEQADLLAERFTNIPIEVVLSSDFVRAHDTARTITETCNVPLEVVPMAGEREVPEGLKKLHKSDPKAKKLMRNFYYEWMHESNTESGEHFDSVRRRVYELTTLLESRPEQHIVVVSHGFFLKFFTAHHILGPHLTPEVYIDFVADRMRMSNTGITYFTVDDTHKWQLYAWSDFAHLGTMS
tara:strand:+ start:5268 stop:5912 length:645 start_codon:yes stop_codon:yes gene_type:complete